MSQLPLGLRRYLVIVWAIGLLAWAASWALPNDPRTLSWPLLAVLLGLLIVAQSLPQHVRTGVKASLNTIPLFIAVLCLPVSAAVSMAVIGVAAAQMGRRRPWCETSFNAARTVLEIFIGGTICAGLAHVGGHWAAPAAAVAAATALYLTNSALVAGAVAAQHRQPFGRIWREVAAAEPLDHVLMFLTGGLVALPWAWMPVIAGLLLMGLAVRVALAHGPVWLPNRQRVRV
jgi:hypothetical protein